MSSVTFRSGLTITDDANPSTGLANGGHRTRFVPALSGTVLAAAEAKDWASKVDALVYDGEYSAKEYAVGNLTVTGGSAKAWATKVGSVVTGVEYSAKEYAVGSAVTEGSAKAWAVGIVGVTLPGGVKSAKEYAADAQSSALTALNSPGTNATSTSNIVLSAGSTKTLTIQTGKAYAIGQFIMCAVRTAPNNYMIGQISAYNSATGVLSFYSEQAGGATSETFNDWVISLTVLSNVAGAASLGSDNSFFGINTFNSPAYFIGTESIIATGIVNLADEVLLTGETSPVRKKTNGVSSIKIQTEGSTSSDFAELNFVTPSYFYKVGVRSNDGYFYVNNGSVDVINYSTTGLQLFKPYRTDDATTSNELVRLSQLSNQSVTSIISEQGSLSGFRNYIINGNLVVNQTGNNVTTNNYSPGVSGWSTDMFRTINSGSTGITFTTSSVTSTEGGRFLRSLKAAVTSVGTINTGGPSNYIIPMETFIESIYAYPLSNKTVTLSFKVKVNRAGTYPVAIRLHDTTSSSTPVIRSRICTFNVTNEELNQFKNVSFTFQMPSDYLITPYFNNYNDSGRRAISIAFNSASTDSYRTSSSNTWLTGNFLDSFDTTAISTRYQFLETSGGAGNGSSFEIANIQLEEGSVATAFENRPFTIEKFLCYRYLQNSYGVFLADYKDSNGVTVVDYPFDVQMAKVPGYQRSGAGTVNYLDAYKIQLAADYRANRRDISVYAFDARLQ